MAGTIEADDDFPFPLGGIGCMCSKRGCVGAEVYTGCDGPATEDGLD